MNDNTLTVEHHAFSQLFLGEYNIWLSNGGIYTNIVSLTIDAGSNSNPSISNVSAYELDNMCKGQRFSIVGSNFERDAIAYFINDSGQKVNADIYDISPGQISLDTRNSPAGQYKRVEVYTMGKTAGFDVNFEIKQCPAVEFYSISPQQGGKGSEVKIIGSNFVSIGIGEIFNVNQSQNGVIISGGHATVKSDTEAMLQITNSTLAKLGIINIEILNGLHYNTEVCKTFQFTITE